MSGRCVLMTCTVLWASHLYIYAYATPLLTRITIMFNGRCCHRIIIIIVYIVVVVWSRRQQLIRNSVRKSYYILSSMVAAKQELHQYFSERNVVRNLVMAFFFPEHKTEAEIIIITISVVFSHFSFLVEIGINKLMMALLCASVPTLVP